MVLLESELEQIEIDVWADLILISTHGLRFRSRLEGVVAVSSLHNPKAPKSRRKDCDVKVRRLRLRQSL